MVQTYFLNIKDHLLKMYQMSVLTFISESISIITYSYQKIRSK